MHPVRIGSFTIGQGLPLVLIAGPCIIEGKSHTLEIAAQLLEITQKRQIPLLFKASYDKANRSSIHSFRGMGMEKGLEILQEVKETYSIPVISDIHLPSEAFPASQVLDVLQIPAFLCRQTDLIQEAAKTGKPLHIKKGQFVAPWDMKNVIEKAYECGNKNCILCERGTTFGYNNLVNDMRALSIMQSFNTPVSYDATHSVQLPGGLGSSSGGLREFIPLLSRAAVAAGIQALFIETHPNPEKALSDSATVLPLKDLPELLDTLIPLHKIICERCV